MDTIQFELEALRKDITEHSLQVKAIIQDINACGGPLAELHKLNSSGRSKIASLREFVDRFGEIAKESRDTSLLKEVVLHREQLASTMNLFKRANIKSMLQIEKDSKDQLLKRTEESILRQRQQKHDKKSLVKQSSNITDQLLSISRQLADTTKQSADTLDSLLTSSDNVSGTQEELKVTGSAITQSGKLLSKYGRREFTDKIIKNHRYIWVYGYLMHSPKNLGNTQKTLEYSRNAFKREVYGMSMACEPYSIQEFYAHCNTM